MPLEPRSPEFARLATRWLDGVATRDEASRLWEAVLESKACAAEFAALARFEWLLEHTCRERALEATVTGALHKERRSYRQRNLIKMAAVLAVLGLVIGMLWPNSEPAVVAVPKPDSTKVAPTAVKRPPTFAIQPTRLLVLPNGAEGPDKPVAKPLVQRLDEFFLTSVSLDRVPLRQAILNMEEQLRSLNYARSQDLIQLRALMPADAASREVTFHSGAISYLKALRAVAGLAGCDISVSDVGITLTRQADTGQQLAQSRSLKSMLAFDSTGLHSELRELLEDARAVGIVLHDELFQSPALEGTGAQFAALAELAASRQQIRAMPEISLLPFLYPAHVGDKGRALTEAETRDLLRMLDQDDNLKKSILKVKPSISGSVGEFSMRGPDYIVSATPSGPYIQATIAPNSKESETVQGPVFDIILPPVGGALLPIKSGQNNSAPPPKQRKEITVASATDHSESGSITLGTSRNVGTLTLADSNINSNGPIGGSSLALIAVSNKITPPPPPPPPPPLEPPP